MRKAIVDAIRRWGIEADDLVPMGGAASEVYGAGDRVIRVGRSAVIDVELAAASAAAAVIPVPRVHAREEVGGEALVLLERVPGTPAWHPGLDPAAARRRGAVCGGLHAFLATVNAPAGVPPVRSATTLGHPPRLLHLDLHPFNVLMSGEEVTAVIDWANAATGPADYDRARTAAIFAFDPTAVELRTDPAARAFVEGWIEAGGLDSLPSDAARWACAFTANDLTPRHGAARLAVLHSITARLEGLEGHVDLFELAARAG